MSPLNRAAFIAALIALYALAAYLDAPSPLALLSEGHRHHAQGEPLYPGGRHA